MLSLVDCATLRCSNRHRACALLVMPCVKELQYVAVTAVYEALKLRQADIAILVKNICLPQSSFNSVWDLYVKLKDFTDVRSLMRTITLQVPPGLQYTAIYSHKASYLQLSNLQDCWPHYLRIAACWISLLVLICQAQTPLQCSDIKPISASFDALNAMHIKSLEGCRSFAFCWLHVTQQAAICCNLTEQVFPPLCSRMASLCI